MGLVGSSLRFTQLSSGSNDVGRASKNRETTEGGRGSKKGAHDLWYPT